MISGAAWSDQSEMCVSCSLGVSLLSRSVAAPTDLADDEHVGVVPVARSRVFLVAGLREADARHARPRVGDVAGDAPEVAAHLIAPLPDVAPAVLAETKDEVAVGFVEQRPHQRDTASAGRASAVRFGLDVRVGAPVVLDVVDAPLRPRLDVLRLVLVAPGESLLTGARAGRRIDADLEALAVHVVGERLHVGEFVVRS